MFENVISTATNDPVRYAAPAVSGVFLLFTYYRAKTSSRGPAVELWEVVRGGVVPLLDTVGRKLNIGYAAYTVGHHEYAGTLDVPPEEAERVLFDAGLRRNPLAAYKSLPDGRGEVGSWAYRDSLLARHQLHVMLFEGENGTTDVYAHRELSSINPAVALGHYRGKGYSPKEGGKKLRQLLPDGVFLRTSLEASRKAQQAARNGGSDSGTASSEGDGGSDSGSGASSSGGGSSATATHG